MIEISKKLIKKTEKYIKISFENFDTVAGPLFPNLSFLLCNPLIYSICWVSDH